MASEGFVCNHIEPEKVSTLTADDPRRLYRHKPQQGLSSSSIRRIHEIFNHAIKETMRLKYISRNPLDDVKPPKASYREMDVLKPEQVRRTLWKNRCTHPRPQAADVPSSSPD
jgi:site-specific recombinase XerD